VLKDYHIEICQRALSQNLSAKAMEVIIAANIGQDRIRYQFMHPHFHFDANAFESGCAYMTRQREIIRTTLQARKSPKTAWQAFGRLTHAAQDFYAHSNYVQLWLDSYPTENLSSPPQIDALDTNILEHPKLHSGKIYFWDWIAFIPGLYRLGLRMTPEDSHTHMNLDHPDRGPLFPYAIAAAIQRTAYEFKKAAAILTPDELAHFTDQ
jgi:hypothetical protein